MAKNTDRRSREEYLGDNRDRMNELDSVLDGLYTEIDKLCKKAPADEVTELALKRVNALITACKELLKGDEFIDSIDIFVPAGERPELRDVLLVLSELTQGMKRARSQLPLRY